MSLTTLQDTFMRIYNIGSLNIDHVYRVPHMVRPGETLASSALETGPGGKGLNQSIALARAGVPVCHVGCIGPEGTWLADLLTVDGGDCSHLQVLDSEATGHAIIQVEESGQNSIVLHAGANHRVTPEQITTALSDATSDDIVLLQNETSSVAEAITIAADRGCQVWFNPAPYGPEVRDLPIDRLAGLIVNETEAADLAGCDNHHEAVVILRERYPACALVCTLGPDGVRWIDEELDFHVPSPDAPVIDTTAAGDTFIGYLLAAFAEGAKPKAACELACAAAAITVSRSGAASAIPKRSEVAD